jgi:hypothetical protein
VDVQAVDPAVLKAHRQKVDWAARLATLQPREHRRNTTDILGAVRHAAFFLNKERERDGIVLIFSDLEQTPQMPAVDAVDFRFESQPRMACFYVNASRWADKLGVSGGAAFDLVVERWQAIFTRAGAAVSKDDFYQKPNFQAVLPKLLPRR